MIRRTSLRTTKKVWANCIRELYEENQWCVFRFPRELLSSYCRIQPAIVSRYEEDVERRINEYKQKTSRRKYAKHDDYASFRQAIYVRRDSLILYLLCGPDGTHRRCSIPTRPCRLSRT